MAGKRQLDEDSIDPVAGVEQFDQLEQVRLAGVGGQLVGEAFHSRFGRGLGFRANIDGACRIFADQHRREPRGAPHLALELRGRSRNPLPYLSGRGFTVDDPRGHAVE